MLRKALLGVSSLALLLAAAACAQEEETSETTTTEPERTAETQTTEPEATETEMAAEPSASPPETETAATSEAQILDPTQVSTKEDARAFAESEFKQADINRDGSIDKEEFLAYAVISAPMEDSAAEAPDTGAMDDPAAAEGEGDMAAADEPADAEEQFAEISNGDQTISETEMVEARVEQFEEADSNGDEQLDPEERKAFVKLATLKPSSERSL